MSTDVCPKCSAELPDYVEECPACGQEIAYCSSPACGMAMLASQACCPVCGEENLSYMPLEETGNIPGAVPRGEPAGGVPNFSGSVNAMPQLDLSFLNKPMGGSMGGGEPPVATGSAAGLPPPTDFPPDACVPRNVSPPQPAEGGDRYMAGGGAEIPGMSFPEIGGALAGMEADTAVQGFSSSSEPYMLEIDRAVKLRKDAKGLLRFRIKGSGGLPPGAAVHVGLSASADLAMGADSRMEVCDLRQGEERELQPIPCRPLLDGYENLTIRVETVVGGQVSDIRTGNIPLEIESPDKHQNITIQAEDIIDFGGNLGLGSLLGKGHPLGGSLSGDWQRVGLRPFRRKGVSALKKIMPPAASYPDTESLSFCPPETVALIVGGGRGERGYVFSANPATLGRKATDEEMPREGFLPVAAASGADLDTRRISGKHCMLRLAAGIPQIMDCSSNGTWLNGNRMLKGAWYTLEDGDCFTLRNVVRFAVHLQRGAKGGASALCAVCRQAGGEIAAVVFEEAFMWPPRSPDDFASCDGGIWISRRNLALFQLAASRERWLPIACAENGDAERSPSAGLVTISVR